jgi:phage shock protein PspC (stress-responsive transcriptional regulator)
MHYNVHERPDDRSDDWSKSMQKYEPSLFARPDTMFGVCQALGEDFGVSPTWFRIGFASAVIFNVEMALAAYVAVGLIVALVRLIHRSPRKLLAVAPVVEVAEATPAAVAPVMLKTEIDAQPELAVAA